MAPLQAAYVISKVA